MGLVKTIFAHIGGEVGAFLAGIWTSASSSGISKEVKTIALQHFNAFLFAQCEGNVAHVDFQTIIPALLVAMTDGDEGVRSGALSCVVFLAGCEKPSSDKGKGAGTGVYGYDTLYGSHSGNCFLENFMRRADGNFN